MSHIIVYLGYRPVRVGWCIREGDHASFRRALELTHTLWGGRYNPIIPVDDVDFGSNLVRTFNVDILVPVKEDDKVVDQFIERFPQIRSPLYQQELFFDEFPNGPRRSALLDIENLLSVARFPEQQRDNLKPTDITWAVDDPLRDVFAASYGVLPQDGIEFASIIAEKLSPDHVFLDRSNNVPSDLYRRFHLSQLNMVGLTKQPLPEHGFALPGLFIGDAGNLNDLVTFWNLRAAGIKIMFFDPRHDRLAASCLHYFGSLPSGMHGPTLWFSNEGLLSHNGVTSNFHPMTLRTRVQPSTWDGTIKAFCPRFEEERSVQCDTDPNRNHVATIKLTGETPFNSDKYFERQHACFTTRVAYGSNPHGHTFDAPFLPELNEYFGRNSFDLYWSSCRITDRTLDFMLDLRKQFLYLRPFSKTELLKRVFGLHGIDPEPSEPGVATSRMIQALGGLERCHILKITGVRDLVRKYGLKRDFTRGDATQIIGQVTNGVPNFDRFKKLPLGQGRTDLKHGFVFDKLVEIGVLRPGLKLHCHTCSFKFWLWMDNIRTTLPCEYCGSPVLVSTQLKEWVYRTSGLLSVNQEHGGITTALTLNALQSNLIMSMSWYFTETAMRLIPQKGSKTPPCESDLFLLGQDSKGKIILVLGECKGDHPINADDIRKLTSVADLFPQNRFSFYILFAKLSAFSQAELRVCAEARGQSSFPRIVLLTPEQLEPLHFYDHVPKERSEHQMLPGFDKFAHMTERLFFSQITSDSNDETVSPIPNHYIQIWNATHSK